jgi:hypothetical protein
MEVTMNTTSTVPTVVPAGLESRVLNEGYGPGAWHGADLKAALAGVTPALAFWRPADGRHNIAEIALHHAYCTRGVHAQISGAAAEPFVVEGDDWFALTDGQPLTWPQVLATVDSEQRRLAALVGNVDAGKADSPLPEAERFNLTLGITCHAIYHAGQIQLIKRLRGD